MNPPPDEPVRITHSLEQIAHVQIKQDHDMERPCHLMDSVDHEMGQPEMISPLLPTVLSPTPQALALQPTELLLSLSPGISGNYAPQGVYPISEAVSRVHGAG